MRPTPDSAPTGLVAALGRWDLTALVVNTIIGSGIFGLPMLITGYMGAASPLAYLAAAAGIGVIVLCFAEVGAQFRAAGGPYLYAREAFGAFAGLQVGWITWLMRITAAAATARVFVTYLAVLWPPADRPAIEAALITMLFAVLAAINYRGVSGGAKASDILVVAKLAPLAIFVGVGLFFVRHDNFFSWMPRGVDWPRGGGLLRSGHGLPPGHDWLAAILLLIFALGGFDNALFPASEMRDPRRDTPFALALGMGIVVVFYLLIQIVFQGTVGAATANAEVYGYPLAAAAERFLHTPGGWLMAVGAMVSIWGWFAATILGTPRLTFALAERGDFPRIFARIHPRYRTPHFSILLYVVASWALALSGSFEWNAGLSAIARLVTYGVTCAALPVFRRRHPEREVFRAPGGLLMPALGVGFCLLLMTQMGRTEFRLLAAIVVLGTLTWLWSRRSAGRA